VGMKGSRVQAVTRELAGERVDIVPWSAEPSLLIGRALSPAVVSSIILHRHRNEATVVVNDDQLSKAIGKEGKNVRLAAKLTEWKIDLVSSREYNIRERVTDEMTMKLGEMEGVSEELLVVLEAVGITSITQLASTPLETLAEVPGLDEESADSLMATAQATDSELSKMITKTITEELEKEVAEDRPLFDENALADGAEIAGEGDDAEPEAEPSVEEIATEAAAAVTGDLFKDLPESAEDGADEDEEKKVDPFANTELDD